ncbi:2-hydroxy-3-oxopropionate reductase [Clostridioides difficile CD149]|uniref:Tartronate semialdehyde reductase n=3 Tax=Clostridioides difficile TaxID=1496 RepID=A0AB74Q7X2_CLODI|nr:2-hydroxy-3-oxopropionate reductase [Clostridioides difficile]AKP43774.1 tartronate semialdehyde reductase [Clostridioides difficile ATCC 9689 = DSM 1296]EQE52659.1 2-hydroxy-3-oxopropionate reductase [Clostridioides difficile CD43]EQE60216.1 2-hydroxy-3-oxopropionate reductase [Clostridioides difficile CD45]EQE68112.1 2-hydroxy-3-oxopropionate reductase [Clostridioides difficile CD47]EQF02043.1 2-hydroxy-3-oxopropionate reductase [Clostridioides difficile CD131]EQF04221.1 2-hydroxy-3-oxop
MKLGFIGLGIMGKPMAKNLLKDGFNLLVYDINKSAVDELISCGAKYASVLEMGQECDIVFTILPNGTIVQDILFGMDGLAKTLKEGSIVVDMSSVTPTESILCANKLKDMGLEFIDSPVSGGEPKAIDGTLAFMAGGKEEIYKKVEPFFNIMGSSSILIGDNGSGSVTKLTNQVIVNLTIAAVSEAFVLAAKAGADPEKVYKAIRGGLAGSTILDVKIPMIMNRDFKPGGKISINLKDIKNVMQTAHNLDVPLPMTSQLLEIMQTLKVHGHLEDDHSGIAQYFEKLAGVEIKKHNN